MSFHVCIFSHKEPKKHSSPLPNATSTIPSLFHGPDPHADHFREFVRRIGVLFAQGGEEDVGAGEGVFEGVVVREGELEVVGDGVELVVFEMGPCFAGGFVGAEVAGRGVWDAVEFEDVPEGGHVEGGIVGDDEGVLDAGEDFLRVEGVEADGVADHGGGDAVKEDVEVVEIIVADVGADQPVFALDDVAVLDDDEADGADAAAEAVGGLKVQGGESHGGSFRGVYSTFVEWHLPSLPSIVSCIIDQFTRRVGSGLFAEFSFTYISSCNYWFADVIS